jgi:signal transduction histidine kinase
MRLDQIFFNILSNSVKFTPPGGHISLVCRQRDGRERQADTLIFTASDDGCGMTEEFQRHMFEPFSQEKGGDGANGQGTGLGLAIVHKSRGAHGRRGERAERAGQGHGVRIAIPAQKSQPLRRRRRSRNSSCAGNSLQDGACCCSRTTE